MRRLPPSREPNERTLSLTPKFIGLTIGLVVGYLLLPVAPPEPAAAIERTTALSPR